MTFYNVVHPIGFRAGTYIRSDESGDITANGIPIEFYIDPATREPCVIKEPK